MKTSPAVWGRACVLRLRAGWRLRDFYFINGAEKKASKKQRRQADAEEEKRKEAARASKDKWFSCEES